MTRLNFEIFRIFELSELNLNLNSSDSEASKIIRNNTKLEHIYQILRMRLGRWQICSPGIKPTHDWSVLGTVCDWINSFRYPCLQCLELGNFRIIYLFINHNYDKHVIGRWIVFFEEQILERGRFLKSGTCYGLSLIGITLLESFGVFYLTKVW